MVLYNYVVIYQPRSIVSTMRQQERLLLISSFLIVNNMIVALD